MHNLPPVVEFSTVVGDDEESCTVAECVIALASPDDSASDMSIWRGCPSYSDREKPKKKVLPVAKSPKIERRNQKRLGVI